MESQYFPWPAARVRSLDRGNTSRQRSDIRLQQQERREASHMRALMFCFFRRVQKSMSYAELSSVFMKA